MGKTAGLLLTLITLLCGFPVLLLEFSPAAEAPRRASAKAPRYKVNYYDISGDSLESLVKEMERKGPVDPGGNRRYGALDWKISWSWPLSSGSRPDYEKTTVTPEIVMTLPRLKNRDGLSRDLLDKWDQYSARLVAHEKNHLRIASETLRRVESRIAALPESMHFRDANRIIREEIVRGKSRDLHYDQATLHGRTEGIVLK